MSRLKIKDMPPVEVVDGTEIIPTGGKGDVSVTVERIKNYVYAGTNFTSLASQLNTVDLRSQNNKVVIDSHIADLLNPHQVTKSQVGLSNVDNTSDLNKPISTATQTALTTLDNTKANTTYVDAGLNTKANITYVDDNLALKANLSDFQNQNNVLSGITSSRPIVTKIGYQYFDTTLGKPIWWNGTSWVDALAIIV